jgi:hypothetical protein
MRFVTVCTTGVVPGFVGFCVACKYYFSLVDLSKLIVKYLISLEFARNCFCSLDDSIDISSDARTERNIKGPWFLPPSKPNQDLISSKQAKSLFQVELKVL